VRSETDAAVQGESPIELLRLYVMAQWQGHGVGFALMRRALDFARSSVYKTVWLGVWERNFKAQEFYRRWGFISVGQHDFILGTVRQVDWIMARSI